MQQLSLQLGPLPPEVSTCKLQPQPPQQPWRCTAGTATLPPATRLAFRTCLLEFLPGDSQDPAQPRPFAHARVDKHGSRVSRDTHPNGALTSEALVLLWEVLFCWGPVPETPPCAASFNEMERSPT
eukprot:226111-Chlamydomonas_euryale.AAC.2